jgi:hypothetical protein
MDIIEIMRRKFPNRVFVFTGAPGDFKALTITDGGPEIAEVDLLKHWPEVKQELAQEKVKTEKAESLAQSMREFYFALQPVQRAVYVSVLAELKALTDLGDLETIGIRVRNLITANADDEAVKAALVALLEAHGV